jgi:hypothetical protein
LGGGCLAVLAIVAGAAGAGAQNAVGPESPYYARVNSFGVLTAYSSDSSHILMGTAENRELLSIGGSYSRRLLMNQVVNWQYNAELLPVALESDPLLHSVTTYTMPLPAPPPLSSTYATVSACHAASGTVNYKINGVEYSFNYVDTCSRQWTIGEGMSPIGFQWNFMPRHKLQPVITSHGGYMYSTHAIPVLGAGAFNFTFDIGAGFELYRSRTQSIRAEYRFHHISDDWTSPQNPGIDNGVFQVTYSFGR